MRAASALAVLAVLATGVLSACGSSSLQFTPPASSGSSHTSTSSSFSLTRAAGPAPYLALGDSVAFGYVAHPAPPAGGGDPYKNAANFVGYPTYVGNTLGLDTTNASCTGETTGSFLDLKTGDNGCHAYRAAYPLHVAYPGQTQMQYATAFLKAHPTTELVTLGLGANDGLLVIGNCGGLNNAACINAQIPALLTSITTNLTSIVQAVRGAGFNGTFVLVNFYSVNYANTFETQLVSQLNGAIATVAGTNHLALADTFSAFQGAANRVAGNTCATGLLASGSSALGACDVHPTLSGQQLIASVIANAAVK